MPEPTGPEMGPAMDGKHAADGPSWVWGLPLAPMTRAEAADAAVARAEAGRPCYFVTANLHYAMLRTGTRRCAPSTRGRRSCWPTGRRWSGPRAGWAGRCRSGSPART